MVEGNGPSRENTKGRNEREKNGGKIIYVESNGDELEELNNSKTKFILRVPEDYPTLRECVAATSKLKETHLILMGEGIFYNLDENEEDENGENGGRPLIINHPIKIEGKGRNKTVLRFGIIGLSGMLELENLSLMNPNGIGIWVRSASSLGETQYEESSSSSSSVSVSLDTVEVHSCHGDGVRVSNGATLTCVECHFHHNGGCGLVVGDEMPKSKKGTDGGRVGESKEEKSSSDDFADVAFDDDGSGGSSSGGGGSGTGGGGGGDGGGGDDWGFDLTDKGKVGDSSSRQVGEENDDTPPVTSSADLTDLTINCNNKSGLKLGDYASVNIFGETTQINYNAKGHANHAGINVGECGSVKIHLKQDMKGKNVRQNFGAGNEREKLGSSISYIGSGFFR